MSKTMQVAANVLVVSALLATAACAPTATRESAGEYVDDAAITTKVKTALLKDEGLKGTQIRVETFRGVVQLSGFVDSQDMASRAVADASRISGVRSVKNDMRLKSR